VHNTPFGDIVDTEDDLQPLVGQMFHDAARAVSLVAAAMTDATFNVEKLAERAGQNWITITELADTLARDHGLPFKAGHTIAARLIAGSRTSPDTPLAMLLRQVSKDVTGNEIVYADAQLAQILSPQHFVEVRKTYGGPSPSETLRAIGVSKAALAADDVWLASARGRLRQAEGKLKAASASL
jgi:argininosuccinate lyase